MAQRRELGRARVEKYKVQYKYVGEGAVQGRPNEQLYEVKFRPTYGSVPGYQEGGALGPDVRVVVKKQGGAEGEWRVMNAEF